MQPDRNNDSTEDLLDRPLPARSLVASLLLRSRPPRMRGSRLVQWCELFGVAEGTTRVALSRMVDRGELRAEGGVYELAGRVQRRRGAQDWSLAPVLSRWRGDWRMAVVASGARNAGERAALRDAMRRLRYGQLREGMWTRPDNLPRASAPAEAWAVADEQCAWWRGRPEGEAALVARDLFGVDEWQERADLLTQRLARVTDAVERSGDEALAEAFVVGAAALAHIRSDPLLPQELSGDGPGGDALRSGYQAYERAFSAALRAWFRNR